MKNSSNFHFWFGSEQFTGQIVEGRDRQADEEIRRYIFKVLWLCEEIIFSTISHLQS